jgi:hypothetical protein
MLHEGYLARPAEIRPKLFDPDLFDPNCSTQTPATGWAERGNISR